MARLTSVGRTPVQMGGGFIQQQHAGAGLDPRQPAGQSNPPQLPRAQLGRVLGRPGAPRPRLPGTLRCRIGFRAHVGAVSPRCRPQLRRRRGGNARYSRISSSTVEATMTGCCGTQATLRRRESAEASGHGGSAHRPDGPGEDAEHGALAGAAGDRRGP